MYYLPCHLLNLHSLCETNSLNPVKKGTYSEHWETLQGQTYPTMGKMIKKICNVSIKQLKIIVTMCSIRWVIILDVIKFISKYT